MGSQANQIRNVFIIFIVSGFWHGPNWTFIVWGLLNALYFLPLLLLKRNRHHTNVVAEHSILPSFREFILMFSTFMLTVLAWIFFRADSISIAFDYIYKLFNHSLVSIPKIRPTYLFALIALFLNIEWAGRRHLYAIEALWTKYPRPVRLFIYYILVIIIYLFTKKEQEFIYFQF